MEVYMNTNNHTAESSRSLQTLLSSTPGDEAVIQFLEVSAQYLNEAAGHSAEPAQRRK